MPIKTAEIIDLLRRLSEEEQLRVTVNESLKAALIAGGAALTGGLLLGPLGIAFAGSLGSVCAALTAKKFLPVADVIQCMTPETQEILSDRVRNIVDGIEITDVLPLAALVAGDATLKTRIVAELANYLRTEMSMAIVDH